MHSSRSVTQWNGRLQPARSVPTNDQTTDQTYQVTEHFIAASNRQDNIKMGLRKTLLQDVDYIYLGTMSDACD